MKKLLLTCVLAIIGAANAAQAEDVTIGTVNMEALLKQSTAVQQLNDSIKDTQQKRKDEVTAQDKKLEAEGKEIQKQRSILEKDAFEKRQKAFQEKIMKIQAELKEKAAKTQKVYNDALAEVQKTTIAIIKDVAEDKDLSIVMPSAQLLFVDENLDITDTVVERLNKELSKLDIKVEK